MILTGELGVGYGGEWVESDGGGGILMLHLLLGCWLSFPSG